MTLIKRDLLAPSVCCYWESARYDLAKSLRLPLRQFDSNREENVGSRH